MAGLVAAIRGGSRRDARRNRAASRRASSRVARLGSVVLCPVKLGLGARGCGGRSCAAAAPRPGSRAAVARARGPAGARTRAAAGVRALSRGLVRLGARHRRRERQLCRALHDQACSRAPTGRARRAAERAGRPSAPGGRARRAAERAGRAERAEAAERARRPSAPGGRARQAAEPRRAAARGRGKWRADSRQTPVWGTAPTTTGEPPRSSEQAAGKLVDVPSAASQKLTLGLLTVAGISFAIMQTLVVPSLPFFAKEFDTSAAWVTWLVTSFLVSLVGADADPGQAGRRARQEEAVGDRARDLRDGEPWRDVRAEHRRADRVPGAAGRRGGDLPAQLRDHPRRVPAARRSGWRSARSARCSGSAVASAWCSAGSSSIT